MSTHTASRFAIAAALLGLALTQIPQAQAITFGDGRYLEQLYDGCATKRDLFDAVRRYGAKPQRLTLAKPGVVLIRGKDRDGLTYDFAIPPCLGKVDGRFLVEHS